MTEARTVQLDIANRLEQREQQNRLEGVTLGDLLTKEEYAWALRLAVISPHALLHEAIEASGLRKLTEAEKTKLDRLYADDPPPQYACFADFFGYETIRILVNHLVAAARGGQARLQLIDLWGPVGSGKNTLVDCLRRALDPVEVVAIKYDPLHQSPIDALPHGDQLALAASLGLYRDPGKLNRVAAEKVIELGGVLALPVELVPVTLLLDQAIATLSNNVAVVQSQLIGDPYGVGPSGRSLPGALLRGPFAELRGLTEAAESAAAVLEDGLESRELSTPGGGVITAGPVCVTTGNKPAWDDLAGRQAKALHDRTVPIKVPYVLDLDLEREVLGEKLQREFGTLPALPHTEELFTLLSVCSKMTGDDRVKRAKLYTARLVVDGGKRVTKTLAELRAEHPNDGMQGLSARFFLALAGQVASQGEKYAAPWNVLSAFEQRLNGGVPDVGFPDDELTSLRFWYWGLVRVDLARAYYPDFDEEVKKLREKYKDAVQALFINKSKPDDLEARAEESERLSLLKGIEEILGVIGGDTADQFRARITATRNGADEANDQLLAHAVTEKLVLGCREMLVEALYQNKNDAKLKQLREKIWKRLEAQGYPRECLPEMLRRASRQVFGELLAPLKP